MNAHGRAGLVLCVVLSIGSSTSVAHDEPLDVLIELRFREPVLRGEPAPLPPWAVDVDKSDPGDPRSLPTRGILLPEVGFFKDGTPFVTYQSLLIPANELQLAPVDRYLCPPVGLLAGGGPSACVTRIHSNPRLVRQPRLPAKCPRPVGGGNIHGLRRDLEADAVANISGGAGVLIVIVDVAVNADHVEQWQGVKLDPDYSVSYDGVKPGEGQLKSHGTMAAYLATVLAPKARLASISTATSGEERLDGAIAGLAHVVERFLAKEAERYSGVVVNNSWAVGEESYQRSNAQCGPGHRATRDVILTDRPCHVFNELLKRLAGDPFRFDLVFAAGNGGQCELSDGHDTIRGPALHPDVITVASVDATRRRLFDSSQGSTSGSKPDISGYAHYQASGALDFDTQTSAATAVVSGLVAAVRSCLGPAAAPARVRDHIMQPANKLVHRASSTSTARQPLTAHDPEFGAGVIQPLDAVKSACPF